MKPLLRARLLVLFAAGGLLWSAAQGQTAGAPRAKPPVRAASAAEAGTVDCDQLWQQYRRSQACYERFRTTTGGLRPGALARCGDPLPDPSDKCGPATVRN